MIYISDLKAFATPIPEKIVIIAKEKFVKRERVSKSSAGGSNFSLSSV